ncbi:MAG: 4Fe-4S dicluster domain-containing protein [Methanomassiliicoccales archaeon]
MPVLVSYPENCTGCRFCQTICSLYHEGVVNLEKARLRVERPNIMHDIPLVCTQCITCEDDCCVDACPEGAISLQDGVVTVDEERCDGCMACVSACPYGVIWVDEVAKKCDLCGGDPMCVKFCPTGALVYEEADQGNYSSMLRAMEEC